MAIPHTPAAPSTRAWRRSRRDGVLALAVCVCAAVPALTACGGGDSKDTTSAAAASATPAASTSPTSTAAPGGDGAGPDGKGGFGADFTAIRDCLSAAGITMPTFARPTGDRPSGMPTGRPTGRWTGRPSGMPSGMRPGGGSNPMASILGSAEAKAALEACGLSMPTFPTDGQPPAGDPGAQPSN